MWKTK